MGVGGKRDNAGRKPKLDRAIQFPDVDNEVLEAPEYLKDDEKLIYNEWGLKLKQLNLASEYIQILLSLLSIDLALIIRLRCQIERDGEYVKNRYTPFSPHPALKRIENAQGRILKYLQELGLTNLALARVSNNIKKPMGNANFLEDLEKEVSLRISNG